MKSYDIFLFVLKNRLWVHVRTASQRRFQWVPESMFKSKKKIRKNEYPGKPQFYFIKVGWKGVYITRTCFHDDSKTMQYTATYAALKSHISESKM